MIDRDIAPELDFPELALIEEYYRASRVYVNRAGAVPQENIDAFEMALAEGQESAEEASDEAPFIRLGDGLDPAKLVGGDHIAYTMGALRGIVGL